jgi:hypothetical protein
MRGTVARRIRRWAADAREAGHPWRSGTRPAKRTWTRMMPHKLRGVWTRNGYGW